MQIEQDYKIQITQNLTSCWERYAALLNHALELFSSLWPNNYPNLCMQICAIFVEVGRFGWHGMFRAVAAVRFILHVWGVKILMDVWVYFQFAFDAKFIAHDRSIALPKWHTNRSDFGSSLESICHWRDLIFCTFAEQPFWMPECASC